MIKRRLRAGGAAIGMVLALIIAMAAPASAAVDPNFDNHSRTQLSVSGLGWTTMANMTYRTSFAVSPWGYFSGFCINVGARWDYYYNGGAEPWKGALEGVADAVAMDAQGRCVVKVSIPNVTIRVRGFYWNQAGDPATVFGGPTAVGYGSSAGTHAFVHAESEDWKPPTTSPVPRPWKGAYEVQVQVSWVMPNGTAGGQTVWGGRAPVV